MTPITQIPSLCESCKYRGLVTSIDPEANQQIELMQRFFCKAPNLMVNAEPFVLDVYSTLSDNNGNLVDVKSTIINCTEYVLGMIVVISSLSYDNNGNTTINYFVSGTSGTDTLDIYLVGNLSPLHSVSPVSDGGGSWVYAAILTSETVYTFYAVLRNANFISPR